MPPIQPIPCATCGGGGSSTPEIDTETVVLCDVLPDGTIAGAAIAVYEYSEETGLPIGAPTFVIPGTNTPYVAQGILQPCDEPCMKCETTILCDNTTVPASEVVASTMVMLDTVNVAGSDGWNVTAYNTQNVTSVQLGDGCPSGTAPPLPLPYPAFYMADWCAAYIAACPAASPAGSGCSLNPGPALGVTSNAEGVGCAGGPTFDTACARYLVEKTFNTDSACTKIRVTSQRFRADGSAKVLIDGQDTGIYGQYNVSSPDGTITLTVAPGAHTMTIDLRDAGSPTWIQGGLTIECLDIVPASTTSVEFLHTVCRSCTGTVISAVDTTFDGTTPYVPGPDVTVCSTGTAAPVCPACESLVLVDTFTDLSGNTVCASFLRTVCRNCDGTVNGTKDTLLDGTSPYTPTGMIGPDCAAPIFAGFVCDAFGGSPAEPATLATCPGAPLAAPANPFIGAGLTEGPPGTFTPTGNLNATYIWRGDPNDQQHGLCTVKLVNDPGTGDDPLWALFGNITEQNGNLAGLDANWITAIETALGIGELTDIPAGSTASAVTGSTTVTITFDGPSNHSQMWGGNGTFFVREQDGDGLAAGVTLSFNPPVQVFQLITNVTVPTPGSISGLQESQATPGTYAVPAQPATNTTVKQFRNPNGTSFYENLDGVAHTVAGTIGDCGDFFQERLCDANDQQFIRLYHLVAGSVASFQDYSLAGGVTATVDPVGQCDVNVADLRIVNQDVLCYTAADGVTVTQFLRRYLMGVDGVTVVATIDTLLDGTTPFVASVGGTVALCSATTGDTGCTSESSIGTVCYTPPIFVPATAMTDDWAGSTIVGPNGGPQTITNSNFFGAGRTVEMTLTKGAGLTGNAVLLGVAPTVANALYQQHLDLGGMVTGLSVTFNSFGTLGNEILRNFSPAFTSIAGAGSAVAGNTGVNPTASNGTVTVTWAGPLSAVDFDWRSQAGGTLSTVSTVAFTTVATGNSTATQGTAAVLVDCETGVVTYRDLATGLVIDIADFTIVDCGSTSNGRDVEVEVLCDSTPTRFLRKYVYNADTGVFASITDTLLDGSTAFAPVGAVTTCPITATATLARDEEVLVLCDSAVTPVKFLRKYNYDVTTGALIGITNTQLDGSTAFVPTGAVQVCPQTVTTDLDFVVIELCDNNGGFLRRFTFNSTTGAVTTTTDTTLAGGAYVTVGTVAICDGCCPIVVGQGCTNVGSLHYTAIRNTNGTISLVDSVTGAAVLAAAIVVCPSDDVVKTLTAQARTLTNATPWTPGADVVGTLTSLSVTGTSGLWDLVDQNGTVLTGLPAGLTLTWSALDDNTLSGPTSVTPQVGSTVIANWTQR